MKFEFCRLNVVQDGRRSYTGQEKVNFNVLCSSSPEIGPQKSKDFLTISMFTVCQRQYRLRPGMSVEPRVKLR